MIAPEARAIVTTTSRKRRLLRTEEWEKEPDEPEAAAAMREWLDRAKWGRGPSG